MYIGCSNMQITARVWCADASDSGDGGSSVPVQGDASGTTPPSASGDSATELTMAEWSGLAPDQKASYWTGAGLTKNGVNAVGAGKADAATAIVVKEGDPMVGSCSFDDHCLYGGTSTARWPWQCCAAGCKLFVDRACCSKWYLNNFTKSAHETLQKDVQMLRTPWCLKCMKMVLKKHKEGERGGAATPKASPAKRKEREPAGAGNVPCCVVPGLSGVDECVPHQHVCLLMRTGRTQTTPMHDCNVATDVPCFGEGDSKCEVYPCHNALHPLLTEVLPALWLPQAKEEGAVRLAAGANSPDPGEGVFARANIPAGTFVLDFGELRETTLRERSGGWKGWSVRLLVETSRSSVSKTYVVKDAHGRHRRGEVPRGGKVNSTCCQVHRNAELVGDSAGIRMYVRTIKKVRVGREILVSFRPDGGFFGGKQGQCRCCWCEKRTPECRA